MKLFEETVNGIHFGKTPFIVFFNKHDLFEEKVQRKSIHCTFPDYNGSPNDVRESSDFIVDKYMGQSRLNTAEMCLYPHLDTATDHLQHFHRLLTPDGCKI